MAEITDVNILHDSVLFYRDLFLNTLTDPVSGARIAASGEKFVLTAYPGRPVRWPIITVEAAGMTCQSLGMSSTAQLVTLNFEANIYSQSPKQRDQITDDIFDKLRTNKALIIASGLHDTIITTSVSLDEDAEGANLGMHRRVLSWTAKHPTTT